MSVFAIQATVIKATEDSGEGPVQLPTFFLDGDVQGFSTKAGAVLTAARIIDPLHQIHTVHIHAERL